VKPLVQTIGQHPLTTDGMNPSWIGYLVFFGGLFWFRNWQEDMRADRASQWSLSRLVAAGLMAWLLTFVFAFPQRTALLWGVAISLAVQLASPLKHQSLVAKSREV